MSRGYTRAQKSLADNYTAGSVVGFHRGYKRLGVEQGRLLAWQRCRAARALALRNRWFEARICKRRARRRS